MRTRPSLAVASLALALSLTFAGAAGAEMPQINTPSTITGTAAVGHQLTAHNGTWLYADGSSCQSDCVMTYQWQRCTSGCADIGGATGRFYTVQGADAGHALRVVETITKHDCGAWNYSAGTQECHDVSKTAPSGMTGVVGGSAPPTSPTPPAAPQPVALLAPAVTAAPTISGAAMVDQTLTATRGVWGGSQPLTLALQWQRCDGQGQNCQDLGLVGDTYTVIAYDIGKTLRVRITALNAAGVHEAVSNPTAAVSELKPTAQNSTLHAAKVAAPHKLLIDQVSRPKRLTRRSATVTVTLRVSDTRGFLIEGALVTAVALPAEALIPSFQTESDSQGFAKLSFAPGPRLKLKKVKSVTIVVTARRPGDRKTSPRASVVRITIPITTSAPKSQRAARAFALAAHARERT